MELKNFLRTIGDKAIFERDKVTVTYGENKIITGTLVPYEVIITWQGDINTSIIHPRENNPVISVKTKPDGIGPDDGTPISIESIISIEKV